MGAAQPQLRLEWRDRRYGAITQATHRAGAVTVAGLAAVAGLAVPVVLYDWASAAHTALELPMAATAWVFGLSHFAQNGYQWGSIVVGILLLGGFGLVSAAAFHAIAGRLIEVSELTAAAAGIVAGFAGWLFFWYTLLPIARDGAPFHATAASALFVAPTWVFVVAFAVFGLAMSFVDARLRRRG